MHCMVDIETLDTTATAVIVSIGAVLFDPYDADAPMDPFYVVLDMHEQLRAGRTASASTISWWMKQSDAARSVFQQPTTAFITGMSAFSRFANRVLGVWGNGSDFDNAILANAVDTAQIDGWRYGRNRCFRTLKNLGKTRDFVEPVRKGTHHNALDDAIYQAEYLQAVVKHLGLTL